MVIKRRWLQNLLLALFGVGLALVIALFVRPYLLPEVPTPTAEAPCQPESTALLAIVKQVVADTRDPCAEFYWRPEPTDEFHVLVRLNNFGLHAPVYSLKKPPGVFRIFIVGDSFPQGMQVTTEQTFPWLLQIQLGEVDGKQVEVINLSVDAYGTDRELLLYAILGWQFQPDLVLLSIYPGNDIQDNQIDLEALRYGYRLNRPFFTLEPQDLCGVDDQSAGAPGSTPPPYRYGEGAGGRGCLHLHNSIQLDSTLYPDSAVFQWLVSAQAAQTPAPPEQLPERPKVTSTNPYTLEYPVELGLYLPEDDYWNDAWALTESLLLQFRDVVKLSGVPFAAFVLPDRRAVHDDDWQATLAQYGDLLPALHEADVNAPATRLEQFLTKNNIPVLNLTPGLRAWAEAHSGGRLYYPDDGHFTPDGHAVTAETIRTWLKESQLVP